LPLSRGAEGTIPGPWNSQTVRLHRRFLLFNLFVPLQAMHDVVGFYKENTEIIAETFTSLGFNVYGAKNAPYVWVHFPGRSSWDVFAEILEKADVVTTPGSGFGPGGEGFVRVSAFGHRENIIEAARRLKQLYR
jgi:LL-diaminopimelate aminotransferase